IPFVDGYGKSYGHFNENSLTVTLRYAPGEKFYQSRSKRSPVNLDAPIFTLRQTFAPQWFSKYPINKTELSVQKRIWFSAFGYLDATVGAARVWSKSCFLDLIIPNANLSYTIQRESFALLNPMEFINDSQVSWFLHYSPNGLLFNLIPGLKKAKLREAFSFSGFYGRLSNKNVPDLNPSLIAYPPMATISRMSHGPYMEAAVGIDNIFRCLRVDYVWRLSYRHPGYNIDRSGIRIAFHATF
ncbi:MAG: carboxypeptidase-like regulatory domain-containing protein, partial [Muribaculaceae bacterium]|nr:carboxypeptidase-like regulatory domain-containing protein [Muribaculaceae bacterium]